MKKDIRILQLGKFYPIRGGVEKVMWDLASGLCERGVHCDMLCATTGDPCEVDFPGTGGGKCICLGAWFMAAATMISPAMVTWMRKHCNEYDIIHIHHPDPMACLALRLSGYKGPVVLHWHSDIIRQKGLLKLYMPLQKWLVGRACRIVGTTPVYVAQSPHLAGVQKKVGFLPIGIKDDIARPGRESAGMDGMKEVFALGRLVSYKGFRYLLEAVRDLTDDYRVVIGGEGPLLNELETLVESLGLEGKVRLEGRLSEEQVREHFNSCAVFVLPSVMKTEAFGIVQLEAMSCGKPVVATTIEGSGTHWVNRDGVSGLNVPPADPAMLAWAIHDICSDSGRYLSFCKGARQRYEELFTYDKMIDGAIGIYEDVIK